MKKVENALIFVIGLILLGNTAFIDAESETLTVAFDTAYDVPNTGLGERVKFSIFEYELISSEKDYYFSVRLPDGSLQKHEVTLLQPSSPPVKVKFECVSGEKSLPWRLYLMEESWQIDENLEVRHEFKGEIQYFGPGESFNEGDKRIVPICDLLLRTEDFEVREVKIEPMKVTEFEKKDISGKVIIIATLPEDISFEFEEIKNFTYDATYSNAVKEENGNYIFKPSDIRKFDEETLSLDTEKHSTKVHVLLPEGMDKVEASPEDYIVDEKDGRILLTWNFVDFKVEFKEKTSEVMMVVAVGAAAAAAVGAGAYTLMGKVGMKITEEVSKKVGQKITSEASKEILSEGTEEVAKEIGKKIAEKIVVDTAAEKTVKTAKWVGKKIVEESAKYDGIKTTKKKIDSNQAAEKLAVKGTVKKSGKCTKCGFENLLDSKFCSKCGAELR